MCRKGKPFALLVGMQTGAATVENSVEIQPFLQYGESSMEEQPEKIKMHLPFDPEIPLLGIYPNEPKKLISKNISTPIFFAVLFTITKIWKQPKCSSVDEWIKQLWDIYTMEFYLAVKKRKI